LRGKRGAGSMSAIGKDKCAGMHSSTVEKLMYPWEAYLIQTINSPNKEESKAKNGLIKAPWTVFDPGKGQL